MGDVIGLGIRTTFDAEAAAARMRELAGFGANQVTGALRFATGYLGIGSVLVVPAEEVWGEAEPTSNQILIRSGLAPEHQEFVLYRSCAQIWVERSLTQFESTAARAAALDAIAAALQAPAGAFAESMAEHGENLEALAEDFAATQTAMALRLGEVGGRSVRVERPGLVRFRGRWRPCAKARRVELTDAVGRVAFIAA